MFCLKLSKPACKLFVIMAALGGAVSAQAGLIDIQMTPVDVRSLYLDDGTWDYSDWSWVPVGEGNGQMDMYETWLQTTPVVFDITFITDSDPLVFIDKDVTNMSAFAWTNFRVDLVPVIASAGPITIVPGSLSSDRFSGTSFVNNGDNSATANFFTVPGAGDTPVLPGQTVSINFTANVPASLSIYRMFQTPTPEPSSLLLLGAAGLFALRRR